MTFARAVALVAASALAGSALGQTTATQTAETTVQIGAAGVEADLFIALIGLNRTQIFSRTPSTRFTPRPALKSPIMELAATHDALYAFTGAALYSLREGRWVPELNLPHHGEPLALLGIGGDLYAIVPSPPSGKLPRLEGERSVSATKAFDPGGAALSLVRYGARGWVGLAALPGEVTPADNPRRHPKLGFIDGAVRVFWLNRATPRIDSATLDKARGAWSATEHIELGGPVDGFWFTTVGGVPCLIVSAPRDGAALELSAFRMLPGAVGGANWRPASLQLSALPAGGKARVYDTAFGFNQHVVLLAADAHGHAVLQFGRLDADPAEQTVQIRDVFEQQSQELFTVHWVQTLTVAILFAIVMGLFVFRRGALVQSLVLPRGVEIALTFQRVLAQAIDLAPFVVLAGYLTGVHWRSGLRQLVDWAIGLDPNRLPALNTLAWWAIATGATACYMTLVELLSRRTLGKLAVGTRVLAETAVAPSAWQIVIRNALRFVELQPPMWVLGFLVLLSRNRQRLGDIFARTVVVRRVATPAEPPTAPPE